MQEYRDMSTFFEQTVGLDRAEVITRVLETQTEAYGYIDIPVLSHELRQYRGGNVLDIGSGDGSFLLQLAEQNTHLNFVGIEHNPEFFNKALSRLAAMRLSNVELQQRFFDATYTGTHDAILTRFTLQHASKPQEFIRSVFQALRSDGCFLCIDPIYDYYDSQPPEKVWQGFRTRLLVTYERWGSNPNVPKQTCKWLSEAGFAPIRATVHLYSPATIGDKRFHEVVMATATMFHLDHPDIWSASFLQELEDWLPNVSTDPFISLAHIMAYKGTPAKNSANQSTR
jgi:ubiquinone/menaquinone biosynthesis C-methylase UbiE